MSETLDGWVESVLTVGVPAAAVTAVLVLAPDGKSVVDLSGVVDVVAGIVLVVAALLFYLRWRVTPDARAGWLVAATVLVGYQVLVNAEDALTGAGPTAQEPHAGWPLVSGAIVGLMLVVLAALGLIRRQFRMPDPMGVGIAAGVIVLVTRLIVLPLVPTPSTGASMVLGGWILLCFVGAAAMTQLNPAVPGWLRRRLGATFVLLGLAQVVAVTSWGHAPTELLSGTFRGVAAVIWTTSAYVLLRQTLDSQRARSTALEGSLVQVESNVRGSRERLHEVRSTVAGLSSASQLLDDPTLALEVRKRLTETIRSELARLDRLVSSTGDRSDAAVRGAASVSRATNLDETLDRVLDLHRSRGRTIDWEPSGATVRAEPDAVAEAINILLENAAAHADSAGSRVAVSSHQDGHVVISVIDHGPGIPVNLRDEVFEWGTSRLGSPGQGIGLNLARRLVTEQGGSLTLAEPGERGSEFMIRLPAFSRPAEHDRSSSGAA